MALNDSVQSMLTTETGSTRTSILNCCYEIRSTHKTPDSRNLHCDTLSCVHTVRFDCLTVLDVDRRARLLRARGCHTKRNAKHLFVTHYLFRAAFGRFAVCCDHHDLGWTKTFLAGPERGKTEECSPKLASALRTWRRTRRKGLL